MDNEDQLLSKIDQLVAAIGSLAASLQQSTTQSNQAVTQAKLAAQAAKDSAAGASQAAANLAKAFSAIDDNAPPSDEVVGQRRTGLQWEFLAALLGRRSGDDESPRYQLPSRASRAGSVITLAAPVPQGAAFVTVIGAQNRDAKLPLSANNSINLVKVTADEGVRLIEVLDRQGFPLAVQVC